MRIRNGIYYICCAAVPHIMLVAGLMLLATKDTQKRSLGRHLCMISAIVLAAGSLVYYIFFTPMFGLD
jgi:hypothetical protein